MKLLNYSRQSTQKGLVQTWCARAGFTPLKKSFGNFLTGFTLIEMIVAITLFTIVTAFASASVLTVLRGNRQVSSTQVLTDNLEFGLEDMVRHLRTGTMYRCGSLSQVTADLTLPRNCSNVGTNPALAVEAQGGDPDDPDDQIIYYLSTPGGLNTPVFRRSSDGGQNYSPVFDERIKVRDFTVAVTGSLSNDNLQPHVRVTIDAEIYDDQLDEYFDITFTTAATQRTLDFDL